MLLVYICTHYCVRSESRGARRRVSELYGGGRSNAEDGCLECMGFGCRTCPRCVMDANDYFSWDKDLPVDYSDGADDHEREGVGGWTCGDMGA